MDDPTLVQVFFDDSTTSVWYLGALEWEDMQVSDALRAELEAFTQHPNRLALAERAAEHLAAEIGAPFVVEVRTGDHRLWCRFSSDVHGIHEPAARAFATMLEEERAWRAD